MKEGKEVDSGGKGGGEELGGVEGREIVLRIYWMREESIFIKMERKRGLLCSALEKIPNLVIPRGCLCSKCHLVDISQWRVQKSKEHSKGQND